MKFKTSRTRPGKVNRRRAGFTLIEVLAALVFMAIVLPVAVEGLRIASLAGQVGVRKDAAARIAERVLHEVVTTSQWPSSQQSGVMQEGVREYQWTVLTETWPEDSMSVITVQVLFQVQGRDYDVQLSTLIGQATL
jgi:prepilin-type N-terminal cleavage/methylation domain-containing protein